MEGCRFADRSRGLNDHHPTHAITRHALNTVVRTNIRDHWKRTAASSGIVTISNAHVRRKATSNKYISSTGKAERQRRGSAARDEIAAEIVESLETALDRFRNVTKALGEEPI
jgi:hypothetical protein